MRATACFSMYSDMSRRIIARSSSKRNSASARAQPLVRPDDSLPETLLHRDELLHLAFEHLRDRHARPLGDDLRHVLLVNLFFQEDALGLSLFELRLVCFELLLQAGETTVAQLRDLAEVADALVLLGLNLRLLDLLLGLAYALDDLLLRLPLRLHARAALAQVGDAHLDLVQTRLRAFVGLALQSLPLDFELSYLAFEHVNLDGQAVNLDAQARGGLVYEVNRLVGQEAVCDVAVRERGRGDDGRVLDADAVVHLVALLQAAQDSDGVLDRRLADEDRLEATLQRRVLLDVLLVLVQGRRADAAQLAARERGLQHVRRVNRALCRARADERVQLVNEEDDLPPRVLDLFEDGLQAVFELAAVLRAREHRAGV